MAFNHEIHLSHVLLRYAIAFKIDIINITDHPNVSVTFCHSNFFLFIFNCRCGINLPNEAIIKSKMTGADILQFAICILFCFVLKVFFFFFEVNGERMHNIC